MPEGSGTSLVNVETYSQQRNAVLAKYLAQLVAAFEAAFPRITGTFTFGAAATVIVLETATTANSVIALTPYNAAAGTLVGSAKSPYISARTPGVSFTVATASAAAAAGGEQFYYQLVNPS